MSCLLTIVELCQGCCSIITFSAVSRHAASVHHTSCTHAGCKRASYQLYPGRLQACIIPSRGFACGATPGTRYPPPGSLNGCDIANKKGGVPLPIRPQSAAPTGAEWAEEHGHNGRATQGGARLQRCLPWAGMFRAFSASAASRPREYWPAARVVYKNACGEK